MKDQEAIIEHIDESLSSLKDFQRATVKSVLSSFNSRECPRVLVADEVGLGKTIIAKGVIGDLVKQHIALGQPKKKKPIRVTYICSNLTLADENRKKLAIFRGSFREQYVKEPSFGRLIETALSEEPGSGKELLEVCSLTPSTSFKLTTGDGNCDERVIVLYALIKHPKLKRYRRKLGNVLRGNRVRKERWEKDKKWYLKNTQLRKGVVRDFHSLLNQRMTDKHREDCDISGRKTSWLNMILEMCQRTMSPNEAQVRTHLRRMLAQTCAKHLDGDLFILDEFQRFKSLLGGNDYSEEAYIARQVFSKSAKSKILLLSATPFKAISKEDDDESGNAHAKELEFLLQFLTNSNVDVVNAYEENRKALQEQILTLRDEVFDLSNLTDCHKVEVEKGLGEYICRTEREQSSESYSGLFDANMHSCYREFSTKDVQTFRALDQLGEGLEKVYHRKYPGQLMEFYKASPWPLSFLSGYQIKKQIDRYKNHNQVRLSLDNSAPAWLSYSDVQQYRLNMERAPQAKFQALVSKIFENKSEELLWIPPSLPHYPLEGSFLGQEDFTKSLLFSSWALVPRALSGLISYEAERRLLTKKKSKAKRYHKKGKHNSKIRFEAKSSLIGWSLVYPSKISKQLRIEHGINSLKDLLNDRKKLYSEKLALLSDYTGGAKSGDRWYALAPILLDWEAGFEEYAREWLHHQESMLGQRKEARGIRGQFKELSSYVWDDGLELGPMPDDLPEYLALLSISGPANTAARAWSRYWPESSEFDVANAATEIGFGAISMFNKPESESVLLKCYKNEKYFKAVVRYMADGDFQSVIDEYGHLLKDAGLPMNSPKTENATSRVVSSLGFRTTSVACQFRENRRQSDDVVARRADSSSDKHTLRCHFAVPLGNQSLTDEQGLNRIGSVRDAFNSPFRPFLLNSTSIGQEGLDFHWYCRRVIHWNLPHNPIDIEQREGRVNRYKSLVVRKRVAANYKEIVRDSSLDYWDELFKDVDRLTADSRMSDLVPYWYYPTGGFTIERFVPLMPMSRDVEKYKHSLKILALYRLAFGQPRQEELLDNLLHRNFSPDDIKVINQNLVINLSPLARDHQA
ncbi:MAG: DEAD/DEAH box helicase [Alcanivoracaceae bacterium]|nr:DEAD/DEAH box helicase [Alcanivoracaceae bacterium]